MSTLDDLKNSFFKFRNRKYAIYVGLLLTLAICSLLIVYVNYLVCFGFLIIALAGYYIPYFFGLKSRKKLAVWGLVLIIVLAIPYSLMVVDSNRAAASEIFNSSDGSLTDGKVSPIDGGASTVHQFSILANNQSFSQMKVQIYDYWAGSEVANATMAPQNVTGGVMYTYSTTLSNSTEYVYRFWVYDGSSWKFTDTIIGPLHVSTTDMFMHWLPIVLVGLLIEIGMLFYLLLALNWLSDRSKAKLAQMEKDLPPMQKKGEGKDEKFVCSECGAEVPGEADKCPQCGERFDEDKKASTEPKTKDKDKDEFFCTECGAKVDENAMSCWNCGKQFEN